MQIKSATAPFPKPLQKAEPSVQVAVDINKNIPQPASRESKPLVHGGINSLFLNPITLSSFLDTRVLLRELL